MALRGLRGGEGGGGQQHSNPTLPAVLSHAHAIDALIRAHAGTYGAGGGARASAGGGGGGSGGSGGALPPLTFLGTQPDTVYVSLTDPLEVVAGLFFAILLSSPIALYAYIFVGEKEDGLVAFQVAQGLPAWALLALELPLNAASYAALALNFFWGGVWLGLRFVKTSPALLTALLAGNGVAVLGVGTLLSAALRTREQALLGGCVATLFLPILASSLMLWCGQEALRPSPWLSLLPLVGPPLGLSHCLERVLRAAVLQRAPLAAWGAAPDLHSHALCLALSGVLHCGGGLLLSGAEGGGPCTGPGGGCWQPLRRAASGRQGGAGAARAAAAAAVALTRPHSCPPPAVVATSPTCPPGAASVGSARQPPPRSTCAARMHPCSRKGCELRPWQQCHC